MSAALPHERSRRLRGGAWGPGLVGLFALVAAAMAYGLYLRPLAARSYGHDIPFNGAMFGDGIEQPIPFSHRLHASDKQIDCQYCHSFAERSLNAGIPPVATCLGCHDHIIPDHEQIKKLRGYRDRGEELPWIRLYYAPDHVFFPHYRHLGRGVRCQECHGEVERVDRLSKVTFYMGFCLRCHRARGAPVECVTCHR
jgi:hypothetical protein